MRGRPTAAIFLCPSKSAVSSIGDHHHIGLNAWESRGGSPATGTAGPANLNRATRRLYAGKTPCRAGTGKLKITPNQVPSTMNTAKRNEYVTRDSMLKLLSDDEVASVTTAETAARLPDGDEYLDLEQLGQGVQRAARKSAPLGMVLPKKALHENTWNKILKLLPTSRGAKVHVGA